MKYILINIPNLNTFICHQIEDERHNFNICIKALV